LTLAAVAIAAASYLILIWFIVFDIIQATWRDIKELYHLEHVCFDRDAWPLLDLMAVLTFPSVIRLKAVMNEKMVGFIAGDRRRHQRLGWVTTIGVLPEYRKLGIGKALLEACEELIDLPTVRLCVRKSNFEAQRLYIKAGYHQIGVWREYYSGNEDAFVYEKHR
jgi:ribosomal protein S18 acetylase RimI-like enzyme